MTDQTTKNQKVEAALAAFGAKMTELRQKRLALFKRIIGRIEAKKLAELETKLHNQS